MDDTKHTKEELQSELDCFQIEYKTLRDKITCLENAEIKMRVFKEAIDDLRGAIYARTTGDNWRGNFRENHDIYIEKIMKQYNTYYERVDKMHDKIVLKRNALECKEILLNDSISNHLILINTFDTLKEIVTN